MSDRIFFGSIVVAVSAAMFAGCEPTGPVTTRGVLSRNPSDPPLPPPPPGAKASETGSPNTGSPNTGRKTNPFDRPAASPAESPASAPSSAESPSAPTIRLSVGIALPQTLPDGTQIGVSVDYKLTRGSLNPSAKYVWVIESRQGEIAMEVDLKPQGGNLAGFLPLAIRPEDSPFKARIDEVSTSGSRVRVSNIESLK